MEYIWRRSQILLFILCGSFFLKIPAEPTTIAIPTPTVAPAARLAMELVKSCIIDITKYRFDLPTANKCPVSYTLICWPELEVGNNISIQCPGMFFATDKIVTRKCYANGTWEKVILNDICNPLPQDIAEQNFLKLLAKYNISVPPQKAAPVDPHLDRQIKIFVTMQWVSLSIMIPSLLLLFIFPNLNDDKMNLHRCLVASFLMSVVTFLPEYYMSLAKTNPQACNALWIINRLFAVCEVTWMFNEGVYLLKTIMFVFSQNSYIWLFFLFGWGFPVVLTLLVWTPVMVKKIGNISGRCWTHDAQNNLMLILYVPMTIMLALNLIILLYVIGVVISKLKQNHSVDMRSKRKAAKGAIVLMPLLGTIYLMIFYAPQGVVWYDYLLVVTQPMQGILVCVVHVFLNKDIHSAIKGKWRKLRGRSSMFQSTKFFSAYGGPKHGKNRTNADRRDTSTLPKKKISVESSVVGWQRKRSSRVVPVIVNNNVVALHEPVDGQANQVIEKKSVENIKEDNEITVFDKANGRDQDRKQHMEIIEENRFANDAS
ncbi:calcitonin gene-related peptide type 1 receptor-like [Rhopilema esculentum]|uniref:calcitonin gene-related peptide type 1 receptor-like n=1 Tax=Rhopilema esculentum TaxID=499914 RepID=UPI0031D874AE